MYVNRPVGAPYQNLLGQTRPFGAAPTTYFAPSAVRPTGSIMDNSPAGSSITANLKALGSSIWAAMTQVFNQLRATIAAQLPR